MRTYIIFASVFLFVFLSWAHTVLAALQITEIMYDPKGANEGHQWIEVYNPDSDPVSIDDTWRFNDGSSHYMNGKAAFTVPSLSFFVLTGDKDTFLADHPSYSGVVIDTSMYLDKDGDTVSLLSAGTPIAQATYTSSMGGSQDDNSLQLINGAWTEGPPTPGMQNQAIPSISAPIVVATPPQDDSSTPENINQPQSSSVTAVDSNPVAVSTVPPPIVTAPPSSPVVPENPVGIVAPPVYPQTPPPVVAVAQPVPTPVIIPVVTQPPVAPAKKKTAKKKPDTTVESSDETTQPAIDLSTLDATAAKATDSPISPIFAYAGLCAVIVIAIGGIFLLRKKKVPEDDLTIEE